MLVTLALLLPAAFFVTIEKLIAEGKHEAALDLLSHSPGSPSALFALLVAALLFSARISHAIALKACRVLLDRGWTTPEKLAATSWEERVKGLDEAGYARYDERTATMLGQTAQAVIELYGGDLRKLREAAEARPCPRTGTSEAIQRDRRRGSRHLLPGSSAGLARVVSVRG